MRPEPPFLLGFAAFSGTGKTALLTSLLPLLTARGLRVGVLKHAHHAFDIDAPGKDSYRFREAGAKEVLVSSSRRWALMHELSEEATEMRLTELVPKFNGDALDLILVEGYKREVFPKIELCRPDLGHPYLYPTDSSILALATDAAPPSELSLPHLDLNHPEMIAAFIETLLPEGMAR